MPRFKPVAAATSVAAVLAGLTAVTATGVAAAAPRPATIVLPGSGTPFTAHSTATSDVPASQRLSIQIWLKPDLAAAQRFAAAVSTPGNPDFHHYLSPATYTARFAASASATASVESWLRSEHFTGIGADAARDYVRATAPTVAINTAFRTTLKLYKASKALNAGPYALRANDGPLTLPSSLAGSVSGVTGLDNAAPVLPLDALSHTAAGRPAATAPASASTLPCSQYYGQHTVTGLPAQFGTTTFPTVVCGYTAGQLRSAYGANMVNTGKGQTVALVEDGLSKDMYLTLQDYAKANAMPAPSATRYAELALGKASHCGDPFYGEEQLDVEAAYDMAPGANELVVGGDSCDNGDFGAQGLFDADIALLNGSGGHPLASAASNSWGLGTEIEPASLITIPHAYLVRAAAEGIGMYFSSGDSSGVQIPASDPYAIAVGGTTLGISETGGRLFETGWSTGLAALQGKAWTGDYEQGAAGGGPSTLWQQPAYQRDVVPPALARGVGGRLKVVRSVPDISADADPFTGIALGLLKFSTTAPPQYHESDIGGTSLAAPLVAGMVTAAQQGQAHQFGFLDPAIYQLSGTSAFTDALPMTTSSPALYRGVICAAGQCGSKILTTFDDQSQQMSDPQTGQVAYTGQVTRKGYDTMSGIGTPNGQDFITALRKLAG